MILLAGAYRIFFIAAGVFAAIAIPVWLALYTGADLGGPEDGMAWHIHEMLFGYLGAALAGFLLTAIPNWTGLPAVTGWVLGVLGMVWLAGRIIMWAWPEAGVVALVFPVMIAALATRDILAGGNHRNLVVAGLVWLFVIAQAVTLWGDAELGQRMGFGLALMMIALIGGRVTPAFSRNWLKAKGVTGLVPEFGPVDKLALGATGATVLTWVVLDGHVVTAVLAALAAVLLFVRLLRWRGWTVATEPLLLTLHAAYAWVPVSFGLLAVHILNDAVTRAQVVHAIGAGAVGTMTLIVMIRALLGHSGRKITASRSDVAILLFVYVGAMLRVIAGGYDGIGLVHLSGTFWALGFALFVARYFPIVLTPRK